MQEQERAAAAASAVAVALLFSPPQDLRTRTIRSPRKYDAAKADSLTGKVTKIEWTHPYVYVYVDVRDDKSGESRTGRSRSAAGPSRRSLGGGLAIRSKADDVINVEGSLARERQPLLSAQSIVPPRPGSECSLHRFPYGDARRRNR